MTGRRSPREGRRKRRIAAAALALLATGSVASTAGAQFPRIAPPPPCTTPATLEGALATAAPARAGVPRILIAPAIRHIGPRAYAYAAQAIVTRLRERLGRDRRLEVLPEGLVDRTIYLSGADVDSAVRLLNVQWTLESVVDPGGTVDSLTFVMRKAGGAVAWRATYYVPRQTLTSIERALAQGIVRAAIGPDAVEPPRLAGSPGRAEADDLLARAEFVQRERFAHAADSARRLYERAFALDTQSTVVAVRLARIYATILEQDPAVGLSPEGALRRADDLTSFALRMDSTNAEAWTVRAITARLRDPVSFTGVLAAHERAIAAAPGSPDAVHQRGETWLLMGEPARAESDFRRALTLERGRAQSLTALAVLESRQGHAAAVCALTNAAIGADPFEPDSYALRALARLQLTQTRDAYADAEVAGRLAAEPWTSALRVMIDEAASNVDEAQIRGRELVRRYLAPKATHSVRDASWIAMALAEVGNLPYAMEALTRARPVGRALLTAMADRRLDSIRKDASFVRLSAEARGAKAVER